MQTVKSSTTLCHPLLAEIDSLYADLSEKKEQSRIVPVSYDESLKGIVDIFQKEAGVKRNFRYVQEELEPLELPNFPEKSVIVCFSGGKDSFSVARHYQELKYNVYLYHLKGLNATYCGGYSEHIMAKKCAEYMGLPLTVEEVSYSGYHEWTEHPMKNMILASRALSWGIRNGTSCKVAVGTFKTAFLQDNPFEVCGGDCVEMWKAYDRVVRRVVPKYRTLFPNENYQTAYVTLTDEPQALPVLISCMTPNRFRKAFRERTVRKYGVDLLPFRCGCCWKDAVEYIWFTDRGYLQLNEPYYIHCLEVLGNTHKKETGEKLDSVKELWGKYFFSPMEKSILYKEIQNATIQSNGKIIRSNNTSEG